MSLVRGGICLVIAFSVLAFGAVEAWSAAVVEISAAVLLLAWAILIARDRTATIQWNALNGPLLAFLAIGLLQLFLGGTAYAFLTRMEVLRVAAYVILFFLAAQAFRKRADLSFLAWFLIVFCFAVSLLGIIQHFTSEGELYWMPSLTIRGDSFGPFVNRNHFAGFVELTLPVGLGLMLFRGISSELLPLATVLTIVPVGALVLSGSRGGIIGFALELCVLAVLARTRRAGEGPRMIALATVALAALAVVAWIGAGKAVQRFSTARQDLTMSRRSSMVRGAAGVFFAHPIKGAGLGTLVAVYPRYETLYDGYVVQHVHNDYMEALAETGVAGGLCGLAFLWLLYREARKGFEAERSHFGRGLRAGAIAAVVGLLLHSFIDFNLHIPSNALLFLLQAFLATSDPISPETRGAERGQRSREYSVVGG
ncbi:MAG: O-antigen ligase family protein [Candidatus Acidiferrales bacterium]